MTLLRSFLALLVALSLLVPLAAQAGTQDQMNTMFSSLTNYSAPGAYEGSRRGVVTGGSLFMRNNITRQQLFSFKPPSFRAGCGGLDWFGGSFSFLNMAQLEQTARAIVQGAAQYAFGLAVQAMCPQCFEIMKDLEKYVQEMNKATNFSCQQAMNLIDESAFGQKMHEAINTKRSILSLMTGDSTEATATMTNNGGTQASTSSQNLNDGSSLSLATTGNIVWEALGKVNADTWFTGTGGSPSDIPIKNLLMSLTGSVIFYYDTTDTDATEKQLQSKHLPALVSLPDKLLLGGTGVEWYDCGGGGTEAIQCKNPIKQTNGTLKGFRQLISEQLFGDGADMGILGKIRAKIATQTYTTGQENLIRLTGISGVLKGFPDQRTAVLVASQIVDALAYDLASGMVAESRKVVQDAIYKNKDKWPVDQAMKFLQETGEVQSKLQKLRGEAVRNATSSYTAAAAVRELAGAGASAKVLVIPPEYASR